jgi:hypothetical protein
LNLLNVSDANKDGLLAVCQDQEVAFYSGSQVFEVQPNKELERFPFQSNGQELNKVDYQKIAF